MGKLSFYLYLLFNLLLIWCNGLKIFEDSLSNTNYKLFYHRTADFGPKLNTYNVSGQLQIMHPLTGCNIDRHLNQTKYTQIYKDQIVLILRGNCTFSNKVHNAELLGAVGVVIGDYNTTNGEEWIVMSKDDDGNVIHIPSVFVPHNTYRWIYKLLLFHSTTSAPSEVNTISAENDNASTSINDEDGDGIDGVYAILDADGEYIAKSNAFWLAAFGIVIIVIPTLWCFIVCMALLRKKIINYVQRSRRRQYLTTIPIILYKGNEGGEGTKKEDTKSIGIGLSVMNSNKTQCDTITVDENEEILVNKEMENGLEMNVRKECKLNVDNNDNNIKHECMENEEDGGSSSKYPSSIFVGTNFKNMSRFLLNQFRQSKQYFNPHNDSCAICLDDFKLNEELRLLPCKHGFHVQCIDPWLSKSSELCPMCKQSIFMNDESQQSSNGCFPSLLKICCVSQRQQQGNENRNNRRRHRRRRRMINNENDEQLIHEESDQEDNDENGVIILRSINEELVSIDSDSNHDEDDDDDGDEDVEPQSGDISENN